MAKNPRYDTQAGKKERKKLFLSMKTARFCPF
jgi:hypothetical protein